MKIEFITGSGSVRGCRKALSWPFKFLLGVSPKTTKSSATCFCANTTLLKHLTDSYVCFEHEGHFGGSYWGCMCSFGRELHGICGLFEVWMLTLAGLEISYFHLNNSDLGHALIICLEAEDNTDNARCYCYPTEYCFKFEIKHICGLRPHLKRQLN